MLICNCILKFTLKTVSCNANSVIEILKTLITHTLMADNDTFLCVSGIHLCCILCHNCTLQTRFIIHRIQHLAYMQCHILTEFHSLFTHLVSEAYQVSSWLPAK